MSQTVAQLASAAGQAANAGRWQEAERLWREVRQLEPNNPQALFSLGIHALQRGERDAGLQLLQAASKAAPHDKAVLLTLANVQRQRGDAAAEREAIDAALAVDPYFIPALLARGNWLERHGSAAAAAATYRNALKIAPPESHWPAAHREQLLHAREVAARHSKELTAALLQRLDGVSSELPAESVSRWREAASIMGGSSVPYRSESNQLYVPRLPAIPFFDPAQFPWVSALEAKTDVIRAELEAALASSRDRFSPYIAYNPGDPVNQWRELNHSDRWSVLHLWRAGEPVEENLAQCPATAAALTQVDAADIGGLCPNAIFSALAPRTHIPPHNGETNARLVAHLPLIVPPRCQLRVGFETREWQVGKVMIFDDTLEHEARNDSDELRVVLIFDVWNPLLAPEERTAVRTLAAAAREFAQRYGI